jgi:hypothetical protein
MKKLKKGEIGYLIDNSYSKCISNSDIKNFYLAGVRGNEAKAVNSISEPYLKEIVLFTSTKYNYEFIQVEYQGEQYEVLNCFHDSFESMMSKVENEINDPFDTFTY